MSIKSHRVKQIIYAEKGLCFSLSSNLGEAIINHEETNDQRGDGGGGIIELQFQYLKEILENKEEHKLDEDEVKNLTEEIEELTKSGRADDDYVLYDMY